jgi:glycerol-3-phosphate dehydrogenase
MIGGVSRDHRVVEHGPYLISLLGGKWTTFRRMAEDTARYIHNKWENTPFKSLTRGMHYHGGNENFSN